MDIKIKTALISVSDKSGLEKIVHSLQEHGVKIVSTGGTAKAIASLICQCWNFPKENILILALVDLPDLGGSVAIKDLGFNVETLIEFEGE